jgi:hypothetical protein
MRFTVAAHISDHYVCAGDELSSSARAIHPGERCRRGNRSAAQLLDHRTRRQFSDLPGVVRLFAPEGGDGNVLGRDWVGGPAVSGGSGEAHACELQQAEFSRPANRRAAVLNAELAVNSALVGLHGIERDV